MKLDLEQIQTINLFEKITKVSARDCFEFGGKLVFLVPEKKIFLAVGKGGSNVEKMSRLLKKKIKIVAYSEDPVNFIKSFVSPIKPEEIVQEGNTIIIKVAVVSERAILIGRNSQNLKSLKEIIKKYYKGVENILIQ